MNVHWLATESGAMLPPAQQVREPEAVYGDLSTEAFEIAHLFEGLQPQSSGYIREQVFIYSVIQKEKTR